MKQLSLAVISVTGLLALATLSSAANAADIGVSVQIGHPGVYGRVDIGRYPQPAVVVQRPVIVHQTVVRAPVGRAVLVPAVQPVYLWVPPGHRKNWSKHCGHYGACSTPVYFVRDDWYRDRGPGHHAHRGDRYDNRYDNRKDHRQDRRDDRRDDRQDRRDDRRDGRH